MKFRSQHISVLEDLRHISCLTTVHTDANKRQNVSCSGHQCSRALNPLSPHDALKHHFTSLKTDLTFIQLGVLNENFHETDLPTHGNFL